MSTSTSNHSPSQSPSKIPVAIAMKTVAESHESLANGDAASSTMTGTSALNGVAEAEAELWVFGYGSLVWKVDFPVAESQRGYIKGFRRRFYQQSIDHRGTPDKPGLVVTLIPDETDALNQTPPPQLTASVTSSSRPASASATASASPNPVRENRVYGVAHRIANDQRAAVIEHLDLREKNGYVRHTVEFYPWPDASGAQHAPRPICLYLASAENASYAGPLPMERIAAQVFAAHGPSGPNVDYVLRLAEAMHDLFPGVPDEHLFELERRLLQMELDQLPEKATQRSLMAVEQQQQLQQKQQQLQ